MDPEKLQALIQIANEKKQRNVQRKAAKSLSEKSIDTTDGVPVTAILAELNEFRAKLALLPDSEALLAKIDNLGKPIRENHIDGSGVLNAATVCAMIRHQGDLKREYVQAYAELIQPQVSAVQKGDLSGLEAMLVSQSISLQTLSSQMIAFGVSHENVEIVEKFMQLAMRAQDQCRKTILALNELRNPRRTTFIKNQADRQINQFALTQDLPLPTAQQLEASPYAPMDTGSTATPARIDPALETVATIDRTSNRGRKTSRKSKQP